MGAAIGLALLGASGLALADGKDRGGRDWDGRGGYDRGGPNRGWQGHGWHDRGRHEGWYRGAPHRHGHPHYHTYPRWHPPHPHYHRNWGPRYGHDDGVTIIFKGRID
jgi:hypothetical protein